MKRKIKPIVSAMLFGIIILYTTLAYALVHTVSPYKVLVNPVIIIVPTIVLLGIIVFFAVRLRSVEIRNKKAKMTDSETGIGNLMYFEYHFENSIPDSARNQYYVAYVIIDSNYLDVYHSKSAFSDVVKYVASVLSENSKQGEIAARITDNGFTYAFRSDCSEHAKNTVNEIITKLNEYVGKEKRSNRPVFHASVYNLDESDGSCEFVLFNLRRNCIRSFDSREQVIFCDEKCMNSARREQEIIERITQGFDNLEFKPYLQFLVDNKTKKIVSAEALSRWENPDKGVLTPGNYIDIMGTTGLISRHDFYIFEMVCRQLEYWNKTDYDHISVSCNFTRLTLSEDDFAEKIKEIADRYSFDKSKLVIEITEDAIEKDIDKAMQNISKCKQLGFSIALDDLGCGYTSLANLCDYTIDIVKIDRDILLKTDNQKGKELFIGIVALSHSLNLKVVCEGVETKEQNEFVTASACDYIQGWHFSKAMPLEECETFINHYSEKLMASA